MQNYWSMAYKSKPGTQLLALRFEQDGRSLLEKGLLTAQVLPSWIAAQS
jgi:hypothetical protein